MELSPGSEFAGYRIESVLGRGGMGIVYLAEHIGMGRKVALKVLASDLAEDERFRERFVRESRLAASLEHPNIVPIHEAGEVGGVLFIAMRYVQGTDLRALLREDGALEPRRAASIVGQLADALDAAHERGLVHRDVKPGNVLIARTTATSGEHVYLSDFGLTKRTSSDSGITGTGQFVGTLEYAAPEQFEGKRLDARTDVYSLGCLLYECLTGEPPFRRDSDAALMYAHLMEQAPTATSMRRELPTAIDPVVSRAMAKNPADRYGSTGALATDVRRALGLAEGPSLGGPARGRGSRAVIAAIAAVGVVIAIVVALSLRGGGGPGPGPGSSSSPTIVGPPLGSVIEIDPSTGTISSTIPGIEISVGLFIRPCMAVGEGGVWVFGGAVTDVDPDHGTAERFQLPHQAAFPLRSIAVGLGDLVMPNSGPGVTSVGAITQIDPATHRIRTIEFPTLGAPTGLAIGSGAIWETFIGGILVRIDPRTLEIVRRFDLRGNVDALAVDDQSVWVGDTLGSTVRFVDTKTGQASEPFDVSGVDELVAEGGSAWVLDRASGTVTQVDPSSGVGQTVRVGDDPTNMVAGLGAVWISDAGGALWRADPLTGEATSIEIGSPLAAVAIDKPHGTVWALVYR
jgi:serine/threonine protein kinase/streptogramin lyase